MQQATNGRSENAAQSEHDGASAVNGAATNGRTESARPIKFSRRDVEIIRVVGQYLQDLGLSKSVEQLMEESGQCLDHPAATRFHKHVLSGDWAKADSDLAELKGHLDHPDDAVKMRFLMLEQKYLELLEEGRAIDALEVLRHQLTPLKHNVQRVHQLSSYIMCSTAEDLRDQSGWPGASAESRGLLMSQLQQFLPAAVMVPGARLQTLLQQSVELQLRDCPFHNTVEESGRGLLVDHFCSRDTFPTEAVQVLREHADEVWYCRFSPDGRMLASGSKDGSIVVWDVDLDAFSVRLRHKLEPDLLEGGHGYALCYLAWSPDSRYLMAAYESPEVRIWDAVTGRLKKDKINYGSNDAIMCGAWHPDGDKFVCGGTHGQFYLFDINGTLHDRWEGVRVRSLWFQNDGQSVLAADTHNRICIFYPDDPKPYEILTETSGDVMSMCINDEGSMAVLNVANHGVHLWDLQDKVMVRKFQGLTQGTFTVHSCFGGINQEFVASGSEVMGNTWVRPAECNVYVWSLRREKPVVVLQGHTSTVSCVSWNPACPAMLASCSDDSTVRVWGPAAHHRAQSRAAAAAGCSGGSGDLSSNGSSSAT